MIRRISILLIMLLTPYIIKAQSSATEIYNQANQAYEMGRFETVDSLLSHRAADLQGEYRVGAYRLLALSSLYLDNMSKADGYISKLLEADPHYTAYGDAPRFADMIEKAKKGKTATITTASKQAETLDEVPVPVTLITSEMIEYSGARNLKELLCAYVPSITNVESNDETNMAMRGLYSASQEVLLIMINGHRLNDYSTNVARPDFSISLDKIKQVEVLRGPASSLYGGVALSGVVNIITKDGSDVNGFTANAAVGNFGQAKGNILFGKRMFNTDVFTWGSLYNATGEKMTPVENDDIYSANFGNVRIGGFNRRPSYDYGLTLKNGGFSLMFNSMFSKTVPQYCIMFCPYDYDRYGNIGGNKPGFSTSSTHINMAYEHSFNKNFSLKAMATYDRSANNQYQVTGDYWSYVGYQVPAYGPDGQPISLGDYAFQVAKWEDDTFGMLLQGNYSYSAGIHEGNLVAGAQLQKTNVHDSYFAEGDSCDIIRITYPVDQKGIRSGSEILFNAFAQYRHVIAQRFIINAGLRYDSKEHTFFNTIREWSPRLSLVYYRPTWSAKVGFSKSFVDASYFCRLNKFDTTNGDPGLRPEYQYSWQASFTKHWTPEFTTELTSFYNNTSNIVISKDMQYVNAGNLKNIGLELTASYNCKRWTSNLTASYQRPLSSTEYTADKSRVFNIPNISANLLFTYRPLDKLNISTHLNVLGEQTSCIYRMSQDQQSNLTNFKIPFHVLWNMNASYTFSVLTFKAAINNIIGKHYLQGGGSLLPLYQQGRWFTIGVGVKI